MSNQYSLVAGKEKARGKAEPRTAPGDDALLIRMTEVTRQYGSGETVVRALDGVSLSINRGEFVSIMGPSGCGKSTLLNLLGALDQPSSGEVWVNGEHLAHLKDVDRFRARTIGFVFQLHNLLPTMTAQENIEVPMMGQEPNPRTRRDRSLELLRLVGLADRAKHLPNQLSGGQRQRVAIARALANDPALVLADEPTGALDSQSGEEILALLAELNRTRGTTIAVVTHDRRVAQTTERILRMRDGRIVDDHRIRDPLEEDLRMLAQSKLGQTILDDADAPMQQITPEEELVLRRILLRAEGKPLPPEPVAAALPAAPNLAAAALTPRSTPVQSHMPTSLPVKTAVEDGRSEPITQPPPL